MLRWKGLRQNTLKYVAIRSVALALRDLQIEYLQLEFNLSQILNDPDPRTWKVVACEDPTC